MGYSKNIFSNLKKRNKKIIFLLTLIAVLVAAFPNLYGMWKTPLQNIFVFSTYPWDTNQYFAFMRCGYEGNWHFTNLYTAETHPPVFLMVFYVFLGHVARIYQKIISLTEGSPPLVSRTIPIVYENARLILSFIFFLLIYWMTGLFSRSVTQRSWTYLIILFGGGLGWKQIFPTESHLLTSCMIFPNFIVSVIFYLLACASFLIALKKDKIGLEKNKKCFWKCLLLSGISGFGIAWVHPFDIPPIIALGIFSSFLFFLINKKFPFRLIIAIIFFIIFALGPCFYQWLIQNKIEEFRWINQNNLMRWEYGLQPVVILEIYLLFAVSSLPFLFKRLKKIENLFLFSWIVTGVAMLFIPFSFQRRMIEGLPIALGFGAASFAYFFLYRLFNRLNLKIKAVWKLRTAYLIILIILLPKTVWIFYERSFGCFNNPRDNYYIPLAEVEALDWLSKQGSSNEVVWGNLIRGNRIPWLSGKKVFYGHDVLTYQSPQRKKFTQELFSFQMSKEEFQNIVKNYNIKYVFWTEADRLYNEQNLDFTQYDLGFSQSPIFYNRYTMIFKLN